MKKVLSIIIAAVLLMGVMPVVSFATNIIESGTCGKNVTWALDETGTLMINGTGEMYNYNSFSYPKWHSYSTRVKYVIIENGITSIGAYAFYFCPNLVNADIPETVTSIGSYAFGHCTSLSSITIPNGVTEIKKESFSYCESLQNVTIPNGVTRIEEYAFYFCYSLASVNIPENVSYIGSHAFSSCGLTRVDIPNISSWCKISFMDEASNPLYWSKSLYVNGSILTDLSIPEDITVVKANSFCGCESLTSLTIHEGVRTIANNAFKNCSGLSYVTIPDSVTSVANTAFSGCSNLYILCNKETAAQSNADQNSIPYGLLDGTEDENTFSGSVGRMDWSIDRLTGTLTLNCLGAMPAFSGSDAPWYPLKKYIRKIIISEGATSIGSYAFYSCTNLDKIEIPSTVTSIGNRAFVDCKNLIIVDIPDGVTSIGDSAFQGCDSLINLTIPDSVSSIGPSAFQSCITLRSVITPICGQQSTFSGCSNLQDVTIRNSAQSISIRYSTFCRCTSLTSIDIPINVTSVTEDAFFDCTALESVYFYNPNCTIYAGATPANATVYGYSGSTAETYADQNGLRFMEIDGHEHHFTVTKTVEPTCTEDGYKNLSCPCGERTTETIPSNGHTEVIVPAKEATCTERGYAEWSYCEVCGETLTEKVETEAKGHTPVTTGAYAATCGKDGFTGVTYCTECKEVLDAGEPIPATNEHTQGEAMEIIVTAATCTEAGTSKTIVKCSACGETLSETTKTISALGHTDGNGDEKCDRCNADMPKSTDTSKKSNVFDFLIQFFKTLADFFKTLFK